MHSTSNRAGCRSTHAGSNPAVPSLSLTLHTGKGFLHPKTSPIANKRGSKMVLEIIRLRNLVKECETEVQKNSELASAAKEVLAAQEKLNAVVAKYPDLAERLEPSPSVSTNSKRRKKARTPRSQVAEDILREAGRPMHGSALLERMTDRGVTFKGKTKPADQLRSSMGKSKRFRNMGANNWWLEGVPSPDEHLDSVSSNSDRYSLQLSA